MVSDSKRRVISVAPIRDRIVHRLLYDHLVESYDKTFDHDVWSCRKGKGLAAGIARLQGFFRGYADAWIWRSDIRKFFDSVDHELLRNAIRRRVRNPVALGLADGIIGSFGEGKGMPIGNLTSQLFANVYLNEFDRFVRHDLKPFAYLRYGDDFVLFAKDRTAAEALRSMGSAFLHERLKIEINRKNDKLALARRGLHFLGIIAYPNGRRLDGRGRNRAHGRMDRRNIASYDALFREHENGRQHRRFIWNIHEKFRSTI